MTNLVNKKGMVCPRCEERQDILAYKRLQQYPNYYDQTAPLYKCPKCRFVFAPLPETLDTV